MDIQYVKETRPRDLFPESLRQLIWCSAHEMREEALQGLRERQWAWGFGLNRQTGD